MTRQTRQLPADQTTLAREIADLRREVRELRAAQRLGHSSISQGAITVLDPDGTVRARFGHQDDGSVALVTVSGPTPPPPTDPAVTPQLAALDVTWDGLFSDGSTLPADWMRAEVHVGATPDFIPDQSTLRTTIETAAGGTVTVPLPYSQWWVRLRSLSRSGVASAASNAVAGTPRQAASADIAAGAITAVQLDADAITGKTITGGTITGSLIQTNDGDGAAITLNLDGNNSLQVWDDNDEASIEIGAGPPAVITSFARGGENLSTRIAGGRIYLALTDEVTGDPGSIFGETTGTLHIEGSTLTGKISTPALRFLPGNGTGTLDVSAAVGTANLTVGGQLVPVPQAPVAPVYDQWMAASNAAYQPLRIIPDGTRVHLDGCASTATAYTGQQNAFTLPAAYRPKKDHFFGTVRSTGGDPRFLGCRVLATGGVTLYATTTVALADTFCFSDISWSLA